VLIAFHKPYGVLSQFTSDGSPNRTLAEFKFPKGIYPIGRLDADSEGLLLLSNEPELNERLLHPRHAHEREYWAQVERIPTAEALEKLSRGMTIQGRKTLPCRAWMLESQPEVVEHAHRANLPHPDPLPSDGRGNSACPPQFFQKRAEQAPASVAAKDGEERSLSRRMGEGRGEGFGGAHGATPPNLPPRIPPIRFRKSVPDCWIGLELVEGKNRQVRRMTAAIGHPTLRLIRVRIGKFHLAALSPGTWKVLNPAERADVLS